MYEQRPFGYVSTTCIYFCARQKTCACRTPVSVESKNGSKERAVMSLYTKSGGLTRYRYTGSGYNTQHPSRSNKCPSTHSRYSSLSSPPGLLGEPRVRCPRRQTEGAVGCAHENAIVVAFYVEIYGRPSKARRRKATA